MLSELLSPKARKKLYLVYALVTFLLGAATTAFNAAGVVDLPLWLVVVTQVVQYTGAGFGVLAAGNINPPATDYFAPLKAAINVTGEHSYVISYNDGRENTVHGYGAAEIAEILTAEGLTLDDVTVDENTDLAVSLRRIMG